MTDPTRESGSPPDIARTHDAVPAEPPDDRSQAPAPADAEAARAAEAAAVERRQFVRGLGTSAVGMAGSMFGLSRMLQRGAVAAGQAVITEFGEMSSAESADATEAAGVAGEPVGAGQEAALPAETAAPEARPEPATRPPAAATASPQAPALIIDADQAALLESASSAVVAVNRDGFPPQLTTATVLWDGETLRFATLGWSRRATMLRADSRIGLLVEGPGDGRFVTVTGQARIVDGRDVRVAMWPLLLREAKDDEPAAEARWQELLAADPDRAVIVVEPDQVLSGRR